MLFFLFFLFVRLVERMAMTHAAVAPHNPGFLDLDIEAGLLGKQFTETGEKDLLKWLSVILSSLGCPQL